MPNFNIPKYPRCLTTGENHTLDGPRAKRAVCRARSGCKPSGDYQDPSVQMNNYSNKASLIPNTHRAKPMKESDRQRAGTLNNRGLLSPATKWKGDIGMGAVRPSFRPSVLPSFRPSVRPSVLPSVRHVSFPEQNTKTVRDILTKLGT